MKKIRLPEWVVREIVKTAKEVFGKEVEVWLFGSRVDPEAKGGDIDLYIETPEGYNAEKLLKFLAKLHMRIGTRKVDVVLEPKGSKKDIALTAKKRGLSCAEKLKEGYR